MAIRRLGRQQFIRGVPFMSSLLDQLKNAGLVDDKKAKQTQKEKRKQQKQARRTGEANDDIKQSAEQARQAKIERDRALNREREAQAQQKAIAAQIRQLVQTHSQPRLIRGEAEVEHNFSDNRKIKKIRLSSSVQQQIIRGQLAIVRQGDDYALVPRVVADKIAERDSDAVVVANTRAQDALAEDDPYKDYVIPDDLMW